MHRVTSGCQDVPQLFEEATEHRMMKRGTQQNQTRSWRCLGNQLPIQQLSKTRMLKPTHKYEDILKRLEFSVSVHGFGDETRWSPALPTS